MDNHPVAQTPTSLKRLADIDVRRLQDSQKPLGGLNPFSPHFRRIGDQFKKLLIDHAGLNRSSRLLDLGCGTGRLANSLTTVGCRYSGLDVHQGFVDYCKEAYQNCEFQRADVLHPEYNPGGTIEATKFEFPYEKNSFSLVTAVALFNHFDLEWIEHYLAEISRVLRPNGLAFVTALLINRQVDASQPAHQFPVKSARSWHHDVERPFLNVAHHENLVRRGFMANGLMIREPIRYGQWVGSRIALAGPDIIVAKKLT